MPTWKPPNVLSHSIKYSSKLNRFAVHVLIVTSLLFFSWRKRLRIWLVWPCPQQSLFRGCRWPCITVLDSNLVDGGQRAVIFDRLRGVIPGSIGEGTHFLVPWLQKAIVFDVRTKPRNISTTTGSKDMQTVSLTLRVLHRPEHVKLNEIYQRLGMDYDERVLPSIGNEVLKAIVAQYDAGELITQREAVSTSLI